MKKIALISHDSTLTGAPIWLAEAAEGMRESGFPAEIYFGLPRPGPLLSRYPLKGVKLFFYARDEGDDNRSIHHRRVRRRLENIIKREIIGGVIANTLEASRAVEAALRARVPVIWMIHEMLDSYRERKEFKKMKRAAAAADRLVFNSQTALSRVSVLGRGLEKKASFVYNGIRIPPENEIREDYRAEIGLGDGDIIIGSIGDLAPVKGHDLLVESFASLSSGDPRLRLVIVGRSPRQFRHYQLGLKEAARDRGLADRIIFAGERKKIGRWLNSFDMLIHPSRVESFGRVVVEALARETPVVAARSGGVEEIDGGEGVILFADIDDPRALAAQTDRLIRSPELRESLGRSGRDLVERRFAFATALRRLEAITAEAFSMTTVNESEKAKTFNTSD